MKPPPPGTLVLWLDGDTQTETVILSRLPPDDATGIPWRVALAGVPGWHEWPSSRIILPSPEVL